MQFSQVSLANETGLAEMNLGNLNTGVKKLERLDFSGCWTTTGDFPVRTRGGTRGLFLLRNAGLRCWAFFGF